ncbi:MAG: tripartite tricarboxylate transporter TctB family protein [Candidatus Accumulibacter sp.]|jgi:uncharacterized membrane protein YhaH (DUF805 family)|nr:tripartite tricarboxylate transporter TctB family protein [Accumulibacter sp.]
MKIRNRKDFWAGLLFLGFGMFFVGVGGQYVFGSAAKMGPGFFPQMVGGILALLGISITLSSLRLGARKDVVKKAAWATVIQILFPVVLFGLLLKPLGLVVCQILLVSLSCFACRAYRWHEAILLALFLALLSYVVFVLALQLQFPIWPVWLAR